MSILLNEFQQPIGTPLPGWTARRPPERVTLTGRLCKVEPLDAARHALDLHTGYVLATNNQDWTYMTMGPFRSADDYRSLHLLPLFGATPVDERVVVDGDWIFAAGVTSGIDGALRLAAEMFGDAVAQRIQLNMAYAPEPPFNSGTPETAPADVLAAARAAFADLTAQREFTAREIAMQLGIAVR